MSLIEMNDVSYSYPNGFEAVKGVNLQVKHGDKIAIIGQNGAGKTTTVKMLNGLIKPTAGSVSVNGKNTKKYSTAQISKEVGYVFQNPDDQIFNNRVVDEIAYALVQAGTPESDIQERVSKYARLCGVEEYLDENPYDLPLSIRKLVTIASVISTYAEVIILDEPTAGQDLKGLNIIAQILDVLVEENRAVITITHDMEFVAQHFEKIIVMADHHIQQVGTAQDIFYNEQLMTKASLKAPAIVQVVKKLALDLQTLDPKALAQALQKL